MILNGIAEHMQIATTDLTKRNERTLRRRDAYREELGDGRLAAGSFWKVKQDHPFIGFVDCRVEDLAFTMFSADDDVVAWHYFWAGPDAYEPAIVSQWLRWARAAETILDIGAYTGLMSIIAALANPACRVHAMEPLERTVERLSINLKANGIDRRVETHPRAAADAFGPEIINLYRDANFLGTGNSIHDKGKKIFDRRLIQDGQHRSVSRLQAPLRPRQGRCRGLRVRGSEGPAPDPAPRPSARGAGNSGKRTRPRYSRCSTIWPTITDRSSRGRRAS